MVLIFEIAMFQYESVDEAVATRHALHGKRWPASNPKLLCVEFRTMDEVLTTVCLRPNPICSASAIYI